MKPVLALLALPLLPLLCAAPAAAQSQPVIGVNRWSSYKAFSLGMVDRATLNNHLEFPIYSRPTVGHAQLNLRLTYDSQLWAAAGTHWLPASGWGFRLAQTSGQLSDNDNETYCGWINPQDPEAGDDGSGTIDDYSFTFVEPDSTTVTSGLPRIQTVDLPSGPIGWSSDCPSSYGAPGTFPVADGKGFTLVVDSNFNGIVYADNGDQVTGAGGEGFSDINGNQTYSTASGSTVTYTDPLGTALTQTTTGSPVSQVTYAYAGPGGQPATVTEYFAQEAVSTDFQCSGVGEWSGTATLPTELLYPDGGAYYFGYDSAGRLVSVQLPTGGVISYSYTLDCTDAGNATMTRGEVTSSGQQPAAVWKWNRVQDSGGAVDTEETGPDNDYSFFAFGDGTTSPVTETDSFDASHNEVLQSLNTVTFDQNDVAQQALKIWLPGTVNLYRFSTTSFDAFGEKLTQSDYDWSPNQAPTNLLRQTVTTFNVLDGFLDQVADVTVSDLSGPVGQTAYFYDSRGNPTSVKEYASSSAQLTKSFTYNSNGTMATATDSNGGVTTYTYGANAPCTGIFPTKIQSPIAVVATTATWDCGGGVETSSTDANGQSTAIAYGDSSHLWRPTAVTRPDGSVVAISYISPTQVEWIMSFNGGASSDDVLTTLDGLGRPMLSQRREAPASSVFDSVQTSYDAMDRVTAVTMPYAGTNGELAPAGTPATSTTYTTLSRPLQVEDAGGGTVSYAYNGNDIETTLGPAPASEDAKIKQEEMDGLGRLESVCEVVTDTGGTTHTPLSGACGQTNALNGYWTKYTRNGQGNITAVLQNAQGSSTQSRSYSFDQLGRMTSETNPESGTTSYTFDASGTCSLTSDGDLVERVDAASNITCYAHDALRRVTGITYPSGPNAGVTAAKTFVYDAAPSVDGTAMANVVGKLAEAYTGPTSAKITDEGFSYPIPSYPSPNTDEVDVYQKSPHSGTWYVTTAQHFPNGAVSQLAAPGVPVLTYWLDQEGRTNGISAALGRYPLSGATYSPLGPTLLNLGTAYTDAYAYDPKTGRMSQYQFTVGGAADTGALAWNANGTLKQLAITDTIPGGNDTETCSYTHDDLGRLAEANCGSGDDEQFALDALGNHSTTQGPSGLVTSFSFSGNRIANGGVNYDADGNLLDDPLLTSQANAFDAEGKPVTFEGVAVTFDALGRAVEASITDGATTEFVYGPDGGKLAVMSGQTLVRADIPLPGGGEAVYHANGFAYYRHGDGLGSAALSTDAAGTLDSSTHYSPYGADESGAGAGYRGFTGEKQDIDSSHSGGQYDFLEREYNPVQGRWWTPDPAGLAAVDPNNPQTWNRYSYVAGSPMEATDPLGLEAADLGPCTPNSDGTFNCGSATAHACGWWAFWCWGGGSSGAGSGPDFGIGGPSFHQPIGVDGDTPLPGGGPAGGPSTPAQQSCQHGVGVGLMVGSEAEIGTGPLGAGAQASAGAGGFYASSTGPTLGGFVTGGAAAVAGGVQTGTPAQQGVTVLGASTGAGVSIFATNAGSANQLAGPFLSFSANLAALLKVSVQVAFDAHGTVFLDFGFGLGAGFSGSGYTTITGATSFVGTSCQ